MDSLHWGVLEVLSGALDFFVGGLQLRQVEHALH